MGDRLLDGRRALADRARGKGAGDAVRAGIGFFIASLVWLFVNPSAGFLATCTCLAYCRAADAVDPALDSGIALWERPTQASGRAVPTRAGVLGR